VSHAVSWLRPTTAPCQHAPWSSLTTPSQQQQQQQQQHWHYTVSVTSQHAQVHARRSRCVHTSAASLLAADSRRGGAAPEPAARSVRGAAPRPAPHQRRNHQITARELLVIFPDGAKQVLGLSAARSAASALQLDLVEVNARASPPIAK
jgi:hypothetical protein